ncbi:MAG: tetratricopeptide repeat protein [Magnetococcales bacterium]|nr:tetratricopeptide repeat protein [Magnetococcales bacterium]
MSGWRAKGAKKGGGSRGDDLRVQQVSALLTEGRWEEAQRVLTGLLLRQPRNPDLLHFMGIVAYQRGRLPEAADWMSRAVALHPGFAAAHNNLGLVFEGLGRLEEAQGCYLKALALQPGLAEGHNNLGNVLMALGRSDAAVESFRQALALRSDYFQAHNNLGNALLDLGRWDEAVACYEKALVLAPRFAEAWRNLGNARRHKGDHARAVTCFTTLLQLLPDDRGGLLGLGASLADLGRRDEALACLSRGRSLWPGDGAILLQLGLLWSGERRWSEAVSCFEAIAPADPEHREARFNLGIGYQELGRLEEAEACLRQVAGWQPERAGVHGNLGLALQKMGRHEEARACLERALVLGGEECGILTNLGFVWQELGRIDTAMGYYHRALAVDPEFAEANFALGLAHLLLGEFAIGWNYYEWRWKKWDFVPHGRQEPLWDGRELDGRRVLLHCEQGFGDSIQFIRCVPLVCTLGARVVVLCPAPLFPLLSRMKGIDFLSSRPEELPRCSFQAPLMSLPGILGLDPTVTTVTVPYLDPDPERCLRFSDLGRLPGLRVGIAWRGNPGHKNDRNRSLPVARLVSLLDVAGCSFVIFQMDPTDAERESMRCRDNLFDLGDRLRDFADTAAAMTWMDLVITVDTALLHLAGALGRPVWGMVAFVPDWRWLLGRDDSPWYPSLRLFRQKKPGCWDSVIEEVKSTLGSVGPSLIPRRTEKKGARGD